MKIDKLSLDGKKTPIEIKDEIFSSKINESLISQVIYKTNATLITSRGKAETNMLLSRSCTSAPVRASPTN